MDVLHQPCVKSSNHVFAILWVRARTFRGKVIEKIALSAIHYRIIGAISSTSMSKVEATEAHTLSDIDSSAFAVMVFSVLVHLKWNKRKFKNITILQNMRKEFREFVNFWQITHFSELVGEAVTMDKDKDQRLQFGTNLNDFLLKGKKVLDCRILLSK